MADTGITVHRVVVNGVELPLPLGDAADEEIVRVSEIIEMLDANDDAQFLLSTLSSQAAL